MTTFFIAGTQRSGTTLLSVMLGRHPEIDIDGNALGYRFTSVVKLHEETVAYNPERSWAELQGWLIEQDYKGRLAEFLDLQQLAQHQHMRGAIAHGIANRLQQNGKSVFGDKVPDMEHFIPQLLMLVPEAKIIHVVRDGRASAESKARRAQKKLMLAAQEWVESTALGIHYEGTLGSNCYKLVRYEDLLQQPEQTARELCDFLGLSFDAAMLESGEAQENAYVKSTLDIGKIDGYKKRLSTGALRNIERLQAPLLQRFGYELHFSDSLQKHAPMRIGKRIRLSLLNQLKQLFTSKHEAMIDRQTKVIRVPFSTRLRTFVLYVGNEFLPKPVYRRVFRKRFIKNVRMK